MRRHYYHIFIALLLILPLIAIVAYTNKANQQSSQTKAQSIPAMTTTVLAENLEIPWALDFLPDGNIIFTERPGKVKILNVATKQVTEAGTVSGVKHGGEGGLMGLALHPQFATNNYVYVYYTFGDGMANRLTRYTLVNNQLTAPTTIIDSVPGNSTHDGGRIRFGPDGFLYVATGDGQVMPSAQDPNALSGKILRVTDTGAPAPGNPFNNRTYSYGHRNPQGLAWIGSQLYATEHGNSNPSRSDEVNLIEPGKNYGWPEIEGDAQQEGMVRPILHSGNDASTTWAPSGTAYWNGALFFSTLKGQGLYEVTVNGATATLKAQHFKSQFGRLREAIVGPDNNLYITTSNRDGRGSPKAGDDKIIKVSLGNQPSTQPSVAQPITPTFGGIAPCPGNPGCPSPEPTSIVSGSPNPSVPNSPSMGVPDPTDPCQAGSASIATNDKEHKKESKHKKHHGGISGFMELLLRFLIELLNLILRLIGGGQIPVPTPNDPGPTIPNPNPSGSPDPCEPSAAPTEPQPTVNVSKPPSAAPTNPANPSPSAPMSSIPPSAGPSQTFACIPSGQKCGAAGSSSCCSNACVPNINPNSPNDPGTCD